MHRGYIKLYRCIAENEIWNSEPFSRGQAWIDVLMLTARKETMTRIRGIPLHLQPGQAALSERWLADRWQWSRGKVERFLSELTNERQIEQQKNNVSTLITVVNWGKYQETEPQTEPQTGPQVEPQTGHRRATNGHIQEWKEGKEVTDKQPIQPPALPDDLMAWPEMSELWPAFLEMRKKKRAPMTPKAAELIAAKLTAWGPDKGTAAIKNSITNGWQGVFEPRQDQQPRLAIQPATDDKNYSEGLEGMRQV